MTLRSAFLLMPFHDSLEWLRDLIVDAGNAAGVHVERADDIFQAGVVVDQIKNRIQSADLVIAICTGQNPNVFFELGIADHFHWPILLAEDANDLPFDIQHYRAVTYRGLDHALLRRALQAAIDATLSSGRKATAPLTTDDHPPRSEPRVLGQFMMQVHVWGLEREGSLEHFPVDVLFLAQDIASTIEHGKRPLLHDFPKRQGVMAYGSDVLEAAERLGIAYKNYDPDNGDWYLALTDKAEAFLRAYKQFEEGIHDTPTAN
jgi:hypothetical protein